MKWWQSSYLGASCVMAVLLLACVPWLYARGNHVVIFAFVGMAVSNLVLARLFFRRWR